MGPRYRKMEDQKPWPGFLRNQDFAEGIKSLHHKLNCINWETR